MIYSLHKKHCLAKTLQGELMTSNEVMKKCLPSRNQKTVQNLEHMLKANPIPLSNTLTPGKAQCYLEQALVSQLPLQLVDLS